MSELIDFLLARIADDETRNDLEVTREADRCRSDGMPDLTEQEVRDFWASQSWWRRQLAECEANRRIVEACRVDHEDSLTSGDDGITLATEVLCLLALPYADHPDYDRAWAL